MCPGCGANRGRSTPCTFTGRKPSGAIAGPGPISRRAALHACRELLRIARFLREAGRLGITRIWTIHNLEPHEGASLWDRLGYRLIARSADIVVSHSVWSLEDAKRKHGARRPVDHHADGHHARGVSAGAAARCRARRARARSGAADDVLPWPHPRVQRARPRMCRGRAPERPRAAGGRWSRAARASMSPDCARRSARVPRAILIPRQLSDQEFADLMGASDAAFLPYRNVTGSAVLLTAIGFGRPVIATDLPYFREVLAPEPEAGSLVDGTDRSVGAGDRQLLRAPLEPPAAGGAPSGRPLLVGSCRRASRRGAGCRGMPRLMADLPEGLRKGRAHAWPARP